MKKQKPTVLLKGRRVQWDYRILLFQKLMNKCAPKNGCFCMNFFGNN